LNRLGIKISNIARLSEIELREEIVRVNRTSEYEDTVIYSLIIAMIELDEYKLESIIDKSISRIGFKSTVTEALYPFLKKVGVMWQSGDVSPVQEHFISNLIRQKLIAATDQLANTFNPKAHKFLLLLPEGEWHEIPLLFAQYLLKEANHEVIYLGQSVPYADVLAIGASRQFDCILVSSTITQPDFDFELYLKDLGGAFPDKKILYYSQLTEENTNELSENHIPLKTINNLTEYLDRL